MNHDARVAALEIGERLLQEPSERLVNTAFASELTAQTGLVRAVGWVDLAHTLRLARDGVIPAPAARELVAALLDLQVTPESFAPRAEFGDLYTNREAWLTGKTSSAAWLGVARARREALTTAFHLTLCDALCGLGDALLTSAETFSETSLRHKGSLMPDYTYLQAAQPTTFGHYLQTFAFPVLRDVDRVVALHARADQCPAGIGSSNGSTIRQDRWALAASLGFPAPVRHARDAMWLHDLSIEACSIAVAASVNLDRLAEDLMIFASAEFGFVRLADRHARASKIMPQKRNPFALAFVRATANRLIGVQTGVSAAGRTPSGQMDNRLFVYAAAPDALTSVAEAALLVAECLKDLTFDAARAGAALADRSVCATDLAERLSAKAKIDYRRAHGIVGALMSGLEATGQTLAEATVDDVLASLGAADVFLDRNHIQEVVFTALDPAACVAARTDYGCAAETEVAAMAEELKSEIRVKRDALQALRGRREEAIDRLLGEAAAFVSEAG
jgi:argininosuccinate lyase